MPHRSRLALTLLGAAALLAGAVASADAGPRRGEYGYVTAESRYGFGSVSGPVRVGRAGRLEVRMPGGTWIECGRSCPDTLRRETVDFWASRDRYNGGTDGPGYLHFSR